MGKLISVIGAGGKTTSLEVISQALKDKRVLVTTTTHIFPMEPPLCRELLTNPGEKELLSALSQPGIVCAGTLSQKNKLSSLPEELLKKAVITADYTVCEADGAHMHPLKLHREGEPVIPEETDICLILGGLSALEKPVSEEIHRYQRNPLWAENPEIPVGPEEILFCIREAIHSAPMPEKVYIFLNQEDAAANPAVVKQILEPLREEGYSARSGSLRRNPQKLTDWIL